MKTKIHVIAHTHWDYEWYFTSNESFIQLCYHVDEVIKALQEGVLDYYMLDGQMSIVEDYLEVQPDKRETLNSLITTGKLKVGPWYTQSDQMIIRGESLVRNLQLGLESGDALGGADRLGYVPDAFGQSIDMPKIFSQMGIDKAVFWRGLSSDQLSQREFLWQSEDGSRLLTYNIKDGYFVGVQLIEVDYTKPLLDQIKQDSTSSHIALPVGGDQRYVDFNLKERIAYYNDQLTDEQLVESNYDQLFAQINEEAKTLPIVQGELLNAEVSKIHRSIYSSRYDHKYLNDKIERRLIYQIEPLMTLADQLGLPYKQELVDKIWKLTLRNHAHDSAGGCNSDKTNQAILQRFIEADQLSYSVVDYLTRKISESRKNLKENQITVFNTLPIEREQVIGITLSLPQTAFTIYHEGKKVAFDIKKITKHSNAPIRKNIHPSPESYYYEIEIALPLKLQPMGYEVLDIKLNEDSIETTSASKQLEENGNTIENEYYQVCFKNGSIRVLDKESNILYPDFLIVEDAGDDGDNYDYSPPANDWKLQFKFDTANVSIVQGNWKSSLKLNGCFIIPKNQYEREQGKATASIPYCCTLKLEAHKQAVDVHLEINNQAMDHRMRLLVNGGVKTEHSIADTPFGTISRPVVDPNLKDWKEKNWKEEPTGLYPMLSFINLHDQQKSITAFTKGIKEYEVIGSKDKIIALTLFRAVGYLGKPDLGRRPGVASGNQFKYIKTPDSQLQKTLTFKCSIQIKHTFNAARAFCEYQKHAISFPYYQQQNVNQFTNTLKYFVMHPLPFQVPETYSFVDATKVKQVVFSSCKKARNRKGVIIRFFNPVEQAIQDGGELICQEDIHFWQFTTMEETIDEQHFQSSQTIPLGRFKPKEIKTIYIEFKHP
ncbi:glycoside hydrolase family 38 C-terminal domain-containing protein [Virgibacillus pantothenticus]|uniref:glycoside hydrolase family 38 N-terminal domain-containing protein n=1 Tax=Virgibacillus pantothenticus TaxID=1473 RepID=UPI0025B13434|nr:glycoside hydrolase family 38 C-terminal domain-containing protein [Virgibacillus pantothenticus]